MPLPGDGLKVRLEGQYREPKSLCAPTAQADGLAASRRFGQKYTRSPTDGMGSGWGGLP